MTAEHHVFVCGCPFATLCGKSGLGKSSASFRKKALQFHTGMANRPVPEGDFASFRSAFVEFERPSNIRRADEAVESTPAVISSQLIVK